MSLSSSTPYLSFPPQFTRNIANNSPILISEVIVEADNVAVFENRHPPFAFPFHRNFPMANCMEGLTNIELFRIDFSIEISTFNQEAVG